MNDSYLHEYLSELHKRTPRILRGAAATSVTWLPYAKSLSVRLVLVGYSDMEHSWSLESLCGHTWHGVRRVLKSPCQLASEVIEAAIAHKLAERDSRL